MFKALIQIGDLQSCVFGILKRHDSPPKLSGRFLVNLGINVAKKFPIEVMDSAFKAWCAYKGDHPDAPGPGSAFDSLYIGAFALLYDGIITRQGDLYRQYYPSLPVIEP